MQMTNLIKYSYRNANNEGFSWFLMANQLLHAGLKLRAVSIECNKKINQITSKEIIYNNSKDSQDILDFQIYRQATMLIGFSIENALKGLLVEQFDNNMGNKLHEELKKTHNLLTLANKVGIELTENEKLILSYFTESIIWSGRYPIPVNDSVYIASFKSNPTFLIKNNDLDNLPIEIEDLIKKINKLINLSSS